MTTDLAIWLLLAIAVVAANLPWLSDRLLFVKELPGGKPLWLRLLEWLLLYLVVGAIALGLERKTLGNIHEQGWEFYTVTLCLFLVFALPGFLYRYDLKHHLERARRRRRAA
ncbi:MAG TPA: DUF2818 family protein [Gammaproteobacteria bacterium]|nr:DUF2818 family protein [Gammaproteobacteria bacterium]